MTTTGIGSDIPLSRAARANRSRAGTSTALMGTSVGVGDGVGSGVGGSVGVGEGDGLGGVVNVGQGLAVEVAGGGGS